MDTYVQLNRGMIRMSYQYFGELLKELRLSRSLTREQLAKSICTSKQIYRIEKGECEPSLHLLNQLSTKFNIDLNEYFKMHFTDYSKISHEGFQQLNGAIENNNIKLLRQLVEEYKVYKEFSEGENLQLIYYSQALCLALLDRDYNNSLACCLQGLLVENPNFSILTIRKSIYSNAGLSLLNCMSKNYFALGDSKTGLSILQDILYVVEHYGLESPHPKYRGSDFFKKIYQLTLYNLGRHLLDLDDVDTALDYVEKGIQFSLKEYSLRFLPELLVMKAQLLYKVEDYEGAKEYYQQAKHLMVISKQDKKLEQLEYTVFSDYPLLVTS